MSRFKFPRATTSFGVFNPREEKNKGKACDIPFTFSAQADLLGMLAPDLGIDIRDEKEDEDITLAFLGELYDDAAVVRRPSLSPLHINRKPEGVTVRIYDKGKKEPLTLSNCRVKNIIVELKAGMNIEVSGMIQYPQYHDAELLRINNLMNSQADMEMEASQSDLFDQPEATEEAAAPPPGVKKATKSKVAPKPAGKPAQAKAVAKPAKKKAAKKAAIKTSKPGKKKSKTITLDDETLEILEGGEGEEFPEPSVDLELEDEAEEPQE
jgi:hypothetical protein